MKCCMCGKELPNKLEITCGDCGNKFIITGDEIVCPNCGKKIDKLHCSNCMTIKEKQKKNKYLWILMVVLIIAGIAFKIIRKVDFNEIGRDSKSSIEVEYDEDVKAFEILKMEAREKTESWYDENDRCIKINGKLKAIENTVPCILEIEIHNKYGKVTEYYIELPRVHEDDTYTVDDSIFLEDCSDAEFTKIVVDIYIK